MKIVYVVPGVMPEQEKRRRLGLLRQWAFASTQVAIEGITEGPASIESCYEEYLSIPPTAKVIVEMEKQGYDAAILGCAGDPGLDAMRELTDRMLVVGPGANSYLAAAMLGHRFAVLTVEDSLIHTCYELARRAGCSEKLETVVALNLPVLELADNREATLDRMIATCKTLVRERGVDSLVLGCMSMGFLDVAEDITRAVGVPCINPSRAALKFAEALVGAGLSHSKKAYCTPPKLRDKKVGSLDALYLRG
jgi:allantoin racemase